MQIGPEEHMEMKDSMREPNKRSTELPKGPSERAIKNVKPPGLMNTQPQPSRHRAQSEHKVKLGGNSTQTWANIDITPRRSSLWDIPGAPGHTKRL